VVFNLSSIDKQRVIEARAGLFEGGVNVYLSRLFQ
jgi:hypothetical protein